jgi:hypothetical protein
MASSRLGSNPGLGYSVIKTYLEETNLLALFTEGPFIQHSELPIPALMYGVIAIGVFILLAFVVFSYRDVANRHDHKHSGSQGH